MVTIGIVFFFCGFPKMPDSYIKTVMTITACTSVQPGYYLCTLFNFIFNKQ